jgi:hypothetical protein
VLVERFPKVHSYRRLLNSHYGVLAEVAWRQGRAAESVKMALLRQQLWENNPTELFRAGCELARAAALLGKDRALPSEQRKKQDQYHSLAVAALRQAVQAGFRDARKLRTERDLELLRPRDDFRALLAGLEAPQQ